MPRAGIGLPQIDLDAPRLLAHCFLYELDKMLVRQHNIDYVEFTDDIDIGVDTIPIPFSTSTCSAPAGAVTRSRAP